MAPAAATTILYNSTVFPAVKLSSSSSDIRLSVFDLPMLSTHYIQKGCLYDTLPPFPHFVSLLESSLSKTLTHFPPLAGRLVSDSNGHIYVTCNDAGVHFVHAVAAGVSVGDVLGSPGDDIPEVVKEFFAFDLTVSYRGHSMPLLAVQVTELADGVFVGCSVNHAVIDGTSLWNFFNTFAGVTRGVESITRRPEFSRDSVFISPAVLKLPDGGPKITFDVDAPVREKIFSFTRESILALKAAANAEQPEVNGDVDRANATAVEISSFQSLCALLWRAVTRARKFPPSKTTTFRMAVNCRHRVEPKLDPFYFGNAIQSIPTYATAGDVLSRDLRWCAGQLNKNVKAHGDATVRRCVEDWERDPRCFPLGNFDGAMITMGSSPRFPMYDNDFGWGRPVAVRSGRANKFDGKISAFPGREGGGTVDLEVVLAPGTMAGVESDPEFMQYVSGC